MGDLDMAKLLSSQTKVPLENVNLSGLKSFGMVMRKQNPVSLAPGGAKFNPQMPFLLGPLIQNPNSFENFRFREASQVSGITKDGKPFQDSGEWYIEVESINENFEPEGYTGPATFPSVMRYVRKAAGFRNSPRATFMAFDEMRLWFNTKPNISVPKIEIKTKLADLSAAMGSSGGTMSSIGSMGDAIFEGVTITLNIREHTQLK